MGRQKERGPCLLTAAQWRVLPRPLVIAPVSAGRLPELSPERTTERRFRLVSDVDGDVGDASRCFLE